MKKRNINRIIILSLLLIIINLVGCKNVENINQNTEIDDINTNNDIVQTDNNKNDKDNKELTIYSTNYSDEDINYDYDSINATNIILSNEEIIIDGEGAVYDDDSLIISSQGVYIVSGTLDNGQIIVDSDDEEATILVLDNVDIYCENSAPIYVINSKKTILNLKEGTSNILSDGNEYSYYNQENEEPNAVLYSKNDLVINGTGELNIYASFNNGINSKDSLDIIDANINVEAEGNGIKGKDYITVSNADINVIAGKDGLKSSNEEDGFGYVLFESGNLSVNAKDDGIDAAGDFNLIKGFLLINTEDDGIHTEKDLLIEKGEITINVVDDGIHSNGTINIDDGIIKIESSYEGIEGSKIIINGGDISIYSEDDGINLANSTNTQLSLRGAMDISSNSSNVLYMNNGNIYINASGDGIDSNGNIYMSGGYVIVDGPVSNGDGALDYGGEFLVSGGELIAVGSLQMAMTPSTSSEQNSIVYSLTGLVEADKEIRIFDMKGNIIVEMTPQKEYQTIVVSASEFEIGETYIISIDGYDDYEIEISDTISGNLGGEMHFEGQQPLGRSKGGLNRKR